MHAAEELLGLALFGVEDLLDDRLAFVDPQRHAELLPWVHAQGGRGDEIKVVVARAADVDRGRPGAAPGAGRQRSALAGRGVSATGTRP